MTETTLPNLGLSGNFAAGVDGWDVDLNHDLRVIDTLVMGTVLSAPANAPPGSPSQGDTYIVGTAPTGAWASNANDVAVWTTNEAGTTLWEFYPPKSGWALELMPTTEGAPVVTYQFIGGVWVTPTYAAGVSVTQGTRTLNGINNIILGTNLSATAGATGTITLNGTGSGGATMLAALTDVNVTEGEGINGYGLTFDEASDKWIATPPAAGGAITAMQGTTSLGSFTILEIGSGLSPSVAEGTLTLTAPGDVVIATGYSGDGTLAANGTFLMQAVPTGFTYVYPAGLTDAHFILATAPASNWTGTFIANGEVVGTLSYGEGSTTPTLTVASEVTIEGPGYFKGVGPATADTAFAGLASAIPGSR